jgi:alpha-methylacyl-CoA racemase
MLCALGILLAIVERTRSGKGQVVDAAMVDGAANLSTLFYGMLAHHLMTLDIGTNVLDSGAPFYQTYETADNKFMAVGAIEGRFYAELLKGLEIDPSSLPHQMDMGKWPEMTERFNAVFKTKSRDEWTRIFEGKDACVAPVLELNEVEHHPHNREREIILTIDDVPQPAPAPRLSRTPGQATPARAAGAPTQKRCWAISGIWKKTSKNFSRTRSLNKADKALDFPGLFTIFLQVSEHGRRFACRKGYDLRVPMLHTQTVAAQNSKKGTFL